MGKISGKLSKKKSRYSKGRSKAYTKRSYKRVNYKGRKKKKTSKKKNLRGGAIIQNPLNEIERKSLRKLMERGLYTYCGNRKYRGGRSQGKCNEGATGRVCKWDSLRRVCVEDMSKIKELIERAIHNNDDIIQRAEFDALRERVNRATDAPIPDRATDAPILAYPADAPIPDHYPLWQAVPPRRSASFGSRADAQERFKGLSPNLQDKLGRSREKRLQGDRATLSRNESRAKANPAAYRHATTAAAASARAKPKSAQQAVTDATFLSTSSSFPVSWPVPADHWSNAPIPDEYLADPPRARARADRQKRYKSFPSGKRGDAMRAWEDRQHEWGERVRAKLDAATPAQKARWAAAPPPENDDRDATDAIQSWLVGTGNSRVWGNDA